VVEKIEKKGSEQELHLANFISAVRASDPKMLNQPILSGHQSTLLCHLGNVAQRTNRVIQSRSSDGHWEDPSIPAELWRRAYDPQWESQIVS
jgi:hypothetical protein